MMLDNFTRAVFTYGTLRPGGSLHYTIADEVVAHHAATLDGFALYGEGKLFPMIVARDGSKVRGDVLHFDPDTWHRTFERLCHIEGVPHLYTADVVTIDGMSVTLFVPGNAERADQWGGQIESGDWFDANDPEAALPLSDSDSEDWF